MTLFQFTLKNLSRRPIRTVLTVLGIGVGIGAVVALMGMARGLGQSWTDAYKARGTDLVVRSAGGGFMAQPFDSTLIGEIRKVPGVAAAANLLTEVLSVEQASVIVVSGREWGSYLWDSVNIIEGRRPKNAEEKAVVLGTLAAEALQKKVGDSVTIEIEDFTVVGIADAKAAVENGSIFIALPHLQKLMQKENRVNFVNIRLDDKASSAAVEADLKKRFPTYRMDAAADVTSKNEGVKAFEAMNWGTSAIALLVGTFGVMNTMFMSVTERTREIGILIALGWRRSRILRMILFESIALCAGAGVLGVLLGIALLKVMALTPFLSGKLEPYIGLDLSAFAFGLALVVGLLSGLAPALHCTKINPSMALRQ